MRAGPSLIIVAGTLWCLTIGTTARESHSLQTAPSAAPVTTGTAQASGAGADYLGSRACARCHEDSQQQWERSLHVRMTKPVAEALVVGDFSDGTNFSDHGRSYRFGRKDGRPFITITFPGREPETFAIDYTLGAKRYQGYLTTLGDGRIWVLPVFWHLESRRWVDWKETTPLPDSAHDLDLRQIWNANCFNCHGTNIVQGYDTSALRYTSSWTEMGIGCEACHGPGRAHVTLMEAWEKDPASKPTYDNSAKNRQLSEVLRIFSPRSAEPRRTYDTCAYCHGNKTNVFVGFRGGDRYEDYALPFLLSDDVPAYDTQGEFWPDGRPNRFNRPQALTLSGCFQAGAVTCTNCHVAHGSRNEHSLKVNIYQGRNGDGLCTQCHREPRREETATGAQSGGTKASFSGPGLQAHTFHKPESAGSRCIGCHMSDVNWRMLVRRRDHTFRAPVPEITARYGVPNACTTCHDDKTPEWAAARMDEWWGDGERRRRGLAAATTLYRAGSGDGTVLSELASVGLDRSQGALLRASAVDYVARMLMGTTEGASAPQSQTSFGTSSGAVRRTAVDPKAVPPALVNALIGAASDPEPMVRAAAVKALAATGEQVRVLPPITARLVDQARVVRARAAEALLSFGIVTLPDRAGDALSAAQDDYRRSLTDFPDSAVNHAALAWLEASTGRTASAHAALDAALRIQPQYARPYIVKGVLAARAGRYDEAIDWWKKVRAFDPSNPRVRDLIAEAEKQKKAGAR
jgi:predicted CXXCH cytochrome family protein